MATEETSGARAGSACARAAARLTHAVCSLLLAAPGCVHRGRDFGEKGDQGRGEAEGGCWTGEGRKEPTSSCSSNTPPTAPQDPDQPGCLNSNPPTSSSLLCALRGFGSDSIESACNAEDLSSIPRSGRSPEEEYDNLLRYSCPGNPWTEEPGGLQSMGSQRVRHDFH